MKVSRPISWIRSARKAFDEFTKTVQADALLALTIAAGGRTAEHVKRLKKALYDD